MAVDMPEPALDGVEANPESEQGSAPPMHVGPTPYMLPPPPPMGFAPPLVPVKPAVPDPPSQADGPGFPFPSGGIAYGKAVRDSGWYRKTDDFLKEMEAAELRATFQLSYIHLYDSNKILAHFLDSLQDSEIVIVSEGGSNAVSRAIFEANLLKHQCVTPSALSELNLEPGAQLVILSDASPDAKLAPSALQNLKLFVETGGILFSFNSGICILEKTFPNVLSYKRGASSIDKPVEIEVLPSACDSLFNGYVLYCGRLCRCHLIQSLFLAHSYLHEKKTVGQLVRRRGMVRFDVVDPAVETLLRETAPDSGRPLAVKFSPGKGTVFQLNITHVCAKVGSQGGSNFLSLGDMLEGPSKTLALHSLNSVVGQADGKKLTTTAVAWRAAYNSGFFAAINNARSYLLTLDFIFELLRAHLRK